MQKVDSKKTINLWEQALHSYDSALKLKTNPDSQHNYAFVKQKLEELKKKQASQGGQDKKEPSDGDKGDDGKGSQQNTGGSSPQNNPGQGKPQDSGQDPSQSQQQAKSKEGQNLKTYSGTRDQDLKDPNIRSKEDAENLLDSLKDDERHINARSLNGDNQVPPPPSGKDW